MYSDYNHPRKGGLGGSLMPILRTSTGRHCMSTGWGEQVRDWHHAMRFRGSDQKTCNCLIYSVTCGKRNKYPNSADMVQVWISGHSQALCLTLVRVPRDHRNYKLFQVFEVVLLGVCYTLCNVFSYSGVKHLWPRRRARRISKWPLLDNGWKPRRCKWHADSALSGM